MRFVLLLPIIFLAISLMFLGFGAAGKAQYADPPKEKSSYELGTESKARATAYCPRSNEGGRNDQREKPLRTLQAYLKNPERAEYVSVAMDIDLQKKDPPGYEYGARLRIPELEEKFKSQRAIEFRLVDNGNAFNHITGLRAIDIAVDCSYLDSGQWDNPQVTLLFEATKRQLKEQEAIIRPKKRDLESRADDLGGPAK